MRLTLIALALVAVTLTACGSDPLGLAAAERIRTDGQVQIAEIDASTARIRMAGAITGVAIGALALVLIVGIAALTHVQAQRDRLSYGPDQWRASLPAQPAAPAVTAGRHPAQPMPLLRLTRGYRAPAPTLALPERSETRRNEVVVIDA